MNDFSVSEIPPIVMLDTGGHNIYAENVSFRQAGSQSPFFQQLVCIGLILALPAKPQAGKTLEAGTNEWGAWTGFSFSNPTLIGTTTGRQMVIAGLRYGFVFGTKREVAFEYTIDLVPAAIVIQPSGTQLASETGNPQLAGRGRPVVYGGGISPIGFKFNFGRGRKWQPFFSSTAGFVYSLDPVPVPVPEATRFNFTFDFGGGVEILGTRGRAFTLGYKLDHISNAGRSQVNPELDANVIYVGFSFLR